MAINILSITVACSSQVSANETERLTALWNGFHADVRLVVYDDQNANLNRRKVAYNTDLSAASDKVKAIWLTRLRLL